MNKLQLGLCCLLLVGALLTKTRAQDDEPIDLQELLVGVSKSLTSFGKTLKENLENINLSFRLLSEEVRGMKSSLEEIRRTSKEIKAVAQNTSDRINAFENTMKTQFEQSTARLDRLGQEVKDHITHSANSLGTFGQIMEEQTRKSISYFKNFEQVLREFSKESSNSCPAVPEKLDAIASKLNDIHALTLTIKSSSQEVKEQVQKSSSSITSIVQNQKEMKETLTTVKEVTHKIHTINNEVQNGSSACSASIEKFLKEQEKWKEILNGKIDKVVEKHGTCDKEGDGDGKDEDKDKDKDKDKEKDKVPVVDCRDVYVKYGYRTTGVYNIKPVGLDEDFPAFCDMDDDDHLGRGGWTVIQRRGDYGNPSTFFSKSWNEYKKGFGDVRKEFWLGNEKISALTNQREYEIKIELRDAYNNYIYARYNDFRVSSEYARYKLTIGGFSGTAGNGLKVHNDLSFSTRDRDNAGFRNCLADDKKTGWWYGACGANLNGARGNVFWLGTDYSRGTIVMKIRPKGY